jgi:O-antigen ligase
MMFVTMGVATAIMVVILAVELGSAILLSSTHLARLSGPYGDLVPGNFLGKTMMPLATILAAMAMGKSLKHGLGLAMVSGLIVIFTIITGERVNSALAGPTVFLASFAQVVHPRRTILFGTLAVTGFLILFATFPGIGDRFSPGNRAEITDYFNSPYWFSVRLGAAMNSPVTGIGVGMHRLHCPAIPQGPHWLVGQNDCHPHSHPHQFYLQLAEETGLFGLLTGIIMIVSIIITAAASRKRRTLYSSLAWILPALLFLPQPSADFFGQWNNLFLWFAIGLALAIAQDRGARST